VCFVSQKSSDIHSLRKFIRENDESADTEPEVAISKGDKKSFILKAPARKKSWWYYDAQALAQHAENKKLKWPYGLVWYHDCDANDHAEMHAAVCAGFQEFKPRKVGDYGVPMLPKPCCEAWLLAYFQDDETAAPYTDCARFEQLDGTSKKARNSPKNVLARRILGSRHDCNDMGRVWEKIGYDIVKKIDWNRVDMHSFNQFKNDFLGVVKKLVSCC